MKNNKIEFSKSTIVKFIVNEPLILYFFMRKDYTVGFKNQLQFDMTKANLQGHL